MPAGTYRVRALPSMTGAARVLRGISLLHRFGSALLRYCARPPFPLERLSVTHDASGRIAMASAVTADLSL